MLILNISDFGFFCLTYFFLPKFNPCTYCSAHGCLDGYGKKFIFWFCSSILWTWIQVSFPFSLLFLHIKCQFIHFFPIVRICYTSIDSCHSLYSVMLTHVFETVVPIIEHKPLAEAILVLNREELISHVLRLILLFMYLNIIAFSKTE